MLGSFLEFLAGPVEGVLTDAVKSTLSLVYQRGLLDGFLLGCVVSMLLLVRRK